jgi:hypothetical protein
MSLYRLHSFLKENSHDILDYWIHDSYIYYVRVVSRKNGLLYFIKVSEHKIEVPVDKPSALEKSSFFFLELDHDDHEILDTLYDVFLRAFPEYNYKYIICNGYYLLQEKELCFQIKNISNLDHFGFYLFVDIEWFYENIYIVNHEIEKILLDIQHKVEKMYLGFLPNYQNFCQSGEIMKMNAIWEYYQQILREMSTCKELYLKIVGTENKTIHDIEFNEKISNSDDLTFNETVRRGHQKKIFSEKLDQCVHLKHKTMQKALYLHCMVWKILLKYLLLISKFTKLQSDFQILVADFESIIPKNRLF